MNSFTFYKNYFELIKYLNDEDRLVMYDSIFNYMFNDKKPKLNGLTEGMWINLKMPLDTSKKQYLNGVKGGCPKGIKKPSMIGNKNASKQTENKSKINQNKTENKTETKTNNISIFLFLFSNLNISNLNNKDNIYKLLEEYLEIRLKNKYIVNETIIKRLINKLNEYGKTDEEKIEIIENAINGAWKDFYELKNKENDKPKYQKVLDDWLAKGDEEND